LMKRQRGKKVVVLQDHCYVKVEWLSKLFYYYFVSREFEQQFFFPWRV